jgi:hypothetical protein
MGFWAANFDYHILPDPVEKSIQASLRPVWKDYATILVGLPDTMTSSNDGHN